MIAFPIGESGQILEIEDQVLDHFHKHKQTGFLNREAGGQLFAILEESRVRVVEATGPRPTDRRTRTSYAPDVKAEQAEIDERFPLGLHFVGDWHTHPEDYPTPSGIDKRCTANTVQRSSHQLHAFVLVIVGRKEFPQSLHVSVHDGLGNYELDSRIDIINNDTGQSYRG